MNYVIAGYSIVLSILFLYGVRLAWRRRRLTRAASRVASATAELERVAESMTSVPMTGVPMTGVPMTGEPMTVVNR